MSEHPTPWKIQIVGKSAHVIDAERNTVSGFDPADDAEFWERIVKSVNNHDVLVNHLRRLAVRTCDDAALELIHGIVGDDPYATPQPDQVD